MAARPSCGRSAVDACRCRAAGRRARRVRPRPARRAAARQLGLGRGPAAADLCRAARRREEARRRGRRVPAACRASSARKLALIGEGPLQRRDRRARRRSHHHARLCAATAPSSPRWLASADIYVSGMADETFGISIIEAQASGLPVVGVAAGAMIDRVTDAIGRLGPVDDADAMARNILDVWNGDRDAMATRRAAHALAVQLGQQHGGAVRPRLSARASTRRARGSEVAAAAPRCGRLSGSPAGRPWQTRPWTRLTPSWSSWSLASPGCSRTIRRRSPITARRPIWSASDEVAVIDPGPDLPEHVDALDRGDRRPAGRRDHVHPHPPRPQPGRAAAGRARPARRSSAARRWRWKRVGPRADAASTAIMRPTACSATARRSRSTASAIDRGGDARATPPTIFASPIGDALVHRRPCDGLVDHRRRPARRRHGRLHGAASTSCGSATTASIIRRTGRR